RRPTSGLRCGSQRPALTRHDPRLIPCQSGNRSHDEIAIFSCPPPPFVFNAFGDIAALISQQRGYAMGRGGKSKPTHRKLMKGRLRASRRNTREPMPKALLLDPPDFLSAPAVEEWLRMGPRLLALGVLTDIDSAGFAAYCQAYGRWRVAERLLAEGDL